MQKYGIWKSTVTIRNIYTSCDLETIICLRVVLRFTIFYRTIEDRQCIVWSGCHVSRHSVWSSVCTFNLISYFTHVLGASFLFVFSFKEVPVIRTVDLVKCTLTLTPWPHMTWTGACCFTNTSRFLQMTLVIMNNPEVVHVSTNTHLFHFVVS